MAKLSRSLAPGTTLHPRENLFASGSLGSLNAEIVCDADGCASFSLDLRGTFNMTIEVAGTVDGTNWQLIPLRPAAGAIYVATVAGAVAGIWVGECGPYAKIRARVTAYTSGSATAYLLASTGFVDQGAMGLVTTTAATTIGTAGVATTLTITSPGAGLRHYLTYLRIVRFATALLTAGAAPVAITTTNLPGTLAFSFPADAAAQGTVFAYQEDFAYPLVSSAQNTNTTIVCPATTSVIWRITAGYYVRP